jgi:imidazole glycerol-phosphate synthase subunit HisF
VFRPRIIPVVLVDPNGHAVKSIRFRRHIDLGDPVNMVSIFNAFRVDELVLLDIAASKEGRLISLELLADIAAEAKMPFSVGGGVNSLADIRRILSGGAEKVVISTAAVERPEFLRAAAEEYGSSSIMVCIDVQRDLFGRRHVRTRGGSGKLSKSPLEAALLMEKMGAGEIIIQSIDHDGEMKGYDLDCIDEIASAVSVPVIALGGAGSLDHVKEAYMKTNASAFASGSLFCFQDRNRGVLVNYPGKDALRSFHGLRQS